MNNKWLKNLPIILLLVFIFAPLLDSRVFPLILIIAAAYFFFNKINLKIKQSPVSNVIDVDGGNIMKHAKKSIFAVAIFIFGFWLFFASIVIIDAGETGVYSLFGRVRDEEMSSGFHLVIPLARVTKMSIRTEEYTMSIIQGEGVKYESDAITALTKEGLNVDLDMTVLYRLDEQRASDVYSEIGLGYAEKIIRPMIRTAIRDIVAQYSAKDIYSDKRGEAASQIQKSLEATINSRGIIIENVLLRNVVLPANLAESIQAKLQAEQEAQRYDFLLDREKKEKERKIIEAEGQRDSQKIINESLTTNYLYYQYISGLKDRQGTIYVPTNPATGMPQFQSIGK